MPSFVRQFGKNIFTSASSLGIRVLLVFFINPFIIHTLGNDRYGVWILVISIVNYMTVLDFGLKQALIRFISRYYGLKNYDKINSILNTAFLIYSIIGLIIVIITFVLSLFAIDWFNVPEELIYQARIVLIIIGISTALNFVMLAWGDSFGAFHRFDISYGLMITEDVLRTVVIVVLLKNGYGLIPFASAFLVFNILRNLAGVILLKKRFPFLRPGFKEASRDTYREIINYSIISFLISIAWLLIVNTDNVLIGYFLDAASVTQYAIAAGFIVYLRSLIVAVSFPLRPLISHYDAVGRPENISYIYMNGTKYLYFLTFILGGAAIVFADSFIYLWLGEGYEQAAVILRILVLPAALAFPQMLAYSVMYGIEKHKKLFYIIIAEGLINVALSVVLVRYYGLNGIAYGTIIPQIILYVLIIPPTIKSILKMDLRQFYMSMLKSVFAAFLIGGGLSYAMKYYLKPAGWGIFFTEIVLVAGLSLMLGYLLTDKEDLKNIVRRFRQA